MDTQIHIPYMCTPTFRHTHRHTCTHTHRKQAHHTSTPPYTHRHTRIQAHTCTPQQIHTEAYPWEPEDHGFLPAPAPALREPGPSFPGGAPGPALAQEADRHSCDGICSLVGTGAALGLALRPCSLHGWAGWEDLCWGLRTGRRARGLGTQLSGR